MRRRGRTRVVYKLLAFGLPLLLSSVLVTAAVLTWTSFAHFRRTVRANYQQILTASAGEIRFFMHNARSGIEALALQVAAVKADPWQQEMLLAAFLHVNGQFTGAALLDPQGRPGVHVAWNVDALAGDTITIEAAAAGRSAVSAVRFGEDGLPYATIAAPVRRLGRVSAVLTAELSLKAVWDVLEGIRIGDTGQIYILDRAGRPVAHREMDRVVTRSVMADAEILQRVTAADRSEPWIEPARGGRPAVYCLGRTLPDLDWIVVLSQELPETYRHVYRNIFWAAVIAAAVALLTVVLGWNRVSRLLAPLQVLHRQVRRMSRGRLDQKIPVAELGRRRDEIGDLGLAFNRMAEELQAHIRRELETARELAHARNLAVIGTTFSKVTHEMGNYFNGLEMALSVVRREPLSPGGSDVLATLEKEARRTREFIRRYLQFSKNPRPRLRSVPLDGLIREAWHGLAPQAEQLGVRFKLTWPPQAALWDVDPALMHQVFVNLFKNSLEAMPGGGRIRVAGELQDGGLNLAVADDGPGLSAGAREHIFDPFFTTKGAAGTGLGMAIVKTFVEAHGGTIACPSDSGKGARFVIRLPADPPGGVEPESVLFT